MIDTVEKIEVIKAQDLSPGDMVLVKCAKRDAKGVAAWAEKYFKNYGVQVSVIYPDMEVQVIHHLDFEEDA